jgi:hypothetical protein
MESKALALDVQTNVCTTIAFQINIFVKNYFQLDDQVFDG